LLLFYIIQLLGYIKERCIWVVGSSIVRNAFLHARVGHTLKETYPFVVHDLTDIKSVRIISYYLFILRVMVYHPSE